MNFEVKGAKNVPPSVLDAIMGVRKANGAIVSRLMLLRDISEGKKKIGINASEKKKIIIVSTNLTKRHKYLRWGKFLEGQEFHAHHDKIGAVIQQEILNYG